MYEKFLYFIENYGYIGVFFSAVLEGETLILLSGVLSSLELLDLKFVLLVACIGAVVGDTSWFLLGRFFGKKLIDNVSLFKKMYNKSVLIDKKPETISLYVRFMYGFRHIVPFRLGMGVFPVYKFIFYNTLGAILWVLLYGVIGYVFTEMILHYADRQHFMKIIVFSIVVLLIVINLCLTVIKRWFISNR